MKVFPILALIIGMIVLTPKYPTIYIALMFGMIGDLFLLSFDKKFFFVGASAFLVQHLFNIYNIYSTSVFEFPYYILGIYAGLMVVFFIASYFLLKKFASTPFLALGAIYGSTLVLNVIYGSIMASQTNNMLYLLFVFGYIFFMISDGFIAQKRFIKPFGQIQFVVMSTYYVAQYLLFLGFMLRFATPLIG